MFVSHVACVCSRECAEVQTLYRQSTEHAAEQNHLIKQLEGLNLDTQKVLRNQEEAHTADTTSYQRVLLTHTHTCQTSNSLLLPLCCTPLGPHPLWWFISELAITYNYLTSARKEGLFSLYPVTVNGFSTYHPSLMTVPLGCTQHYTEKGIRRDFRQLLVIKSELKGNFFGLTSYYLFCLLSLFSSLHWWS